MVKMFKIRGEVLCGSAELMGTEDWEWIGGGDVVYGQ